MNCHGMGLEQVASVEIGCGKIKNLFLREIVLEISDFSSPCEAITACLTPIIGIYYNRYMI